MPGSLCAVADCLAPVHAEGMEVVAPPASQKPAGIQMEGEAEGMFGHTAGSAKPAGRPRPGLPGTLSCSFASKLSFLDSTVGFVVLL